LLKTPLVVVARCGREFHPVCELENGPFTDDFPGYKLNKPAFMVGMFQFAMLNNQIKHDDFQFANSTQKPVAFATAKNQGPFFGPHSF